VEDIEVMFISGEEFLLLVLSSVERKDLVHDDQHDRGRTAGHAGARYQRPISGQTALGPRLWLWLDIPVTSEDLTTGIGPQTHH